MFQQLNAEGITVVLVTHDPKVAAYAHRTIRIVEGMIEGDEGSGEAASVHGPCRLDTEHPAPGGGTRPNADCEARQRHAEKPRRAAVAPALLPATWRTALGALRRNKMRSGLSALGVIIAVAAVIAMTEIGQGSKATLQKGIASMGANTLMIFAGTTTTGGVNQGTGTR